MIYSVEDDCQVEATPRENRSQPRAGSTLPIDHSILILLAQMLAVELDLRVPSSSVVRQSFDDHLVLQTDAARGMLRSRANGQAVSKRFCPHLTT